MRLLALAGFLLAFPSIAAAQSPDCRQTEADRRWVVSLWDAWNRVRPAPHPEPVLVTYDAACMWQVDRDVTTGRAHAGTVTLPDGEEMPPAVASFVSAFGPDNRPFIVIAGPSVWRSQPNLAADPNLDRLIRAVFVHEMTHVLQTPWFGPQIDALSTRLPDPDALTDDIIQDTFGEDAMFREMYERERDLFYQALETDDAARRRELVERAVTAMEARRARFFAGDKAFYRDLENLFLVMEGAGQWAGYRLLRAEGVDEMSAVAQMRRGGRRWSQDEGLAIFLLLEAQGGDWRSRVFGSTLPPGIPELLRR